MIRKLFVLITLLALLSMGASPAQARPVAAGQSFTGILNILDGDARPEAGVEPQTLYTLALPDGANLLLHIDAGTRITGDLRALRDHAVTITGQSASADGFATGGLPAAVTVESLRPANSLLAPTATDAQIGSKPWVTIACKFADVSAETKPLSYFSSMYDNAIGRIDHFFRELSYNQMNVVGSLAYGWFVLPKTNAQYTSLIVNGNYSPMLDALANDCTAAANPTVNFAPFTGINMMFNATFGDYAWGGSRYITLDGKSSFYLTWEPPWGINDIAVIKHEMGHGFGLPHSSGMYSQVYDNPWDIMSDSWKGCWNNFNDTTYGCMGQGTIGYHRDRLGWIPADKKISVGNGQSTTITLDWLEKASVTNYRMATVPISGTSKYYTVEARGYTYTPALSPWPGYDEKFDDWLHAFGDSAIVIHEVDPSRSDGRPAKVVDIDGNGNNADAGTIFQAGETYSPSGTGIIISVLSASTNGWVVRIGNNAGPFNKSAPANAAANQDTSLTISWAASAGASGYEYCYDDTNDNACATWVSAGTNTSANLSGLSPNTTYYWQVRANGPYGEFYANSSTYWSFSTVPGLPTAFSKSAPASGAVNQSLAPTLSWGTASGATSYEYCYDLTNDSACTNWVSAGTATSAVLSGLANGATYYWQARARNGAGATDATGGFWSFSTVPAAPAAFSKSSPANAASNQPLTSIIRWAASSGATSYEYCYDTTNDSACSNWINAGTALSATLSSLSNSTTYYWQARAKNAGGTTDATGGFWSFGTLPAAPTAFAKSSPANAAVNQPLTTIIRWAASSGAASYEYCYDTTNDSACSSWVSAGAALSATLNGLVTSTTYYWQARAKNAGGTTDSTGGFWNFSTVPSAPAAFAKSSPANGAAGQALNLTLTWAASSGATGYEYCYDTTNDNACALWSSTATPSASLTGLVGGTTYYWQARAVNPGGTTYASSGYWSFTTSAIPPASFGMLTPTNGAAAQPYNPTLAWQASAGAASYEYCLDTTNDGACSTTWVNTGSATQAPLTLLLPNTTYYWIVRAVNPGGTTYANAWRSFTTASYKYLYLPVTVK